MKFWDTGCIPSKDHSYLRDVYGIPDYVTSVENEFRVKHGIFSWSIVNLSDFPETKLEVAFCHSPSFQLLDTAWSLQLCPKASLNGQRGISLRLMRDANDSGPEKILASYRLGVGKSNNDVWFEAKESTFWKGNFFQLNTTVLGFLEDFLTDGVDKASVMCEIYVSYLPTFSKEVGWEVSEIDDSLPADMSALLTSNHTMDALIEIRNHQMWAHKSILSVRSKTLETRLKHISFTQLSCSIQCLKCVLSYMYTGSFDYLARNAYFSIGLFEIADELDLIPLRDLLYPDRRSNESRIHIQNIDKPSTAPFNMRRFLSNTTFKIKSYHDKGSGLQASILVYKIGYPPNYCAAFKLEIRNIVSCFHGETSLSLYNKFGGGIMARFLSQDMSSSGSVLTSIFVLTAEEFILCDVVRSKSISIKVAFKIYQMRHDHVRISGFAPPPKPVEPWCRREQLAQDLKTLLHHEYLSDASMVVGEQTFKVYRPLLAARSPYFHSLFYGGKNALDVYLVIDLMPRTFWLMLNYIYCGTLSHFSDLTLEDFTELCRVSMNFGLSSLLRISSLFMEMMTGDLNFVDS